MYMITKIIMILYGYSRLNLNLLQCYGQGWHITLYFIILFLFVLTWIMCLKNLQKNTIQKLKK